MTAVEEKKKRKGAKWIIDRSGGKIYIFGSSSLTLESGYRFGREPITRVPFSEQRHISEPLPKEKHSDTGVHPGLEKLAGPTI